MTTVLIFLVAVVCGCVVGTTSHRRGTPFGSAVVLAGLTSATVSFVLAVLFL